MAMIIDGHCHACGPYLTNETIREYSKLHNIDYIVLTAGERNSRKIYSLSDKTEKYPFKDLVNSNKNLIKFVVTVTGAAGQIPDGNHHVFELKQKNDRIRQFYWITKETVEELEKKYEEMRFDGMKIHQCWVKKEINSPGFESLTDFLTAKDLPLFIHLESYREIEDLINLHKKTPQLKLIVGHCFGIEEFMERAGELSPNLFFDISNNYFVSEKRLIRAVEALGHERFTLGSDTPYGKNSLKLTIERVRNLPVAGEVKDAVLGGNMARLLKIH